MFLVTGQAGVSGYRSGWCFWLQVRLVFLVTGQAGVSGYRPGWCFWLQIRLVFLVTDQAGVCGYRSGWCLWLQVRLVFVVTDQAGVCGYRSGETASCTVVFVMIYYFTMAGLLWFVMLCYAWHVTFRALGTPRDDLSSKTAYFHLVSWSLPLVLTIVCLAISEVCGGVCVCVCVCGVCVFV